MRYNGKGDEMKTILAFYKNLDSKDIKIEGLYEKLNSLYDTYKKHQLSDAFFQGSIEDIKNRIQAKEKPMLDDNDVKWVNMILNFEIFRIGTLRFQLFPMDHEEIERNGQDFMHIDKTRFHKGRPLINIHIEDGADISPQAVDASINQARIFFTRIFPQYSFDGFVIRSWLIHPNLVSLLNPNSKIAQFAKRFEMVSMNHAFPQTLKRVYGTEDLEVIKDHVPHTTLEKLVYPNYQKLGNAFGYLPFGEIV